MRIGLAFCFLWERREPRSPIPFTALVSLHKSKASARCACRSLSLAGAFCRSGVSRDRELRWLRWLGERWRLAALRMSLFGSQRLPPAAHAGHFLLLAQEKVTKEKGCFLTTLPCEIGAGAGIFRRNILFLEKRRASCAPPFGSEWGWASAAQWISMPRQRQRQRQRQPHSAP
jgi:hypothetical protein